MNVRTEIGITEACPTRATCITLRRRTGAAAIAVPRGSHLRGRRSSGSTISANADLAFDRGDELGRVVADAVLEHRRHVADVCRLCDRVAANDGEIRHLANRNRSQLLVDAKNLRAVEGHDLNRLDW